MKPHVTMHMLSSIDGRIVSSTWPEDLSNTVGDLYEEIHKQLKGDAWIVGRTTMDEFAKGEPKPEKAQESYPRTTWKAPAASKGPYAVALDRAGKLHLNMDRANGDALVAVLTEAVSDDHLAELRRDGISYLFAGQSDIDLAQALDALNTEFGIKRLLLEGGGGINGSFLDKGLIDEISLIVVPVADGTKGPTVFDRKGGDARQLELTTVEQLDDGIVHLRYRLA